MNHKDIFTTHDVARLLSVDASTIIDWIDQNKLPGYRTPGGHRRVKKEDLSSFLKAYRLPAVMEVPSGSPVVLVVEDDADMRLAMEKMIKGRRPDAEVHHAADGFMAGKQIQELKPSVVVLDLFLPGVNGFRVCKHIREDPALSQTRIVAVSGFDTAENRKKILQAGADIFLSKPLGLRQLAETVDRLLGFPVEAAVR
jgi:excisionase family DNA binding protein